MQLILESMLFGLATILRRRSKNPLVQATLRGRNCAVQVRTRDNGVGRSFVFCGGAVFSQRGVLASPDVSLVWQSAAVATRALLRVRFEIHGWALRLSRLPPMATRIMAWETSIRRS